jgi:hypothetical protein
VFSTDIISAVVTAPQQSNLITPSFVLSVFASITSLILLVIKLIEFRNDRARLSIDVCISLISDGKLPHPYHSFQITFINRGRRKIIVIGGIIPLPAGGLKYVPFQQGESPLSQLPVTPPGVVGTFHVTLFDAGTGQGLVIEEHSRVQKNLQPFDLRPLYCVAGKDTVAVFTDAIGNEYKAKFFVPPRDEIKMTMEKWAK